MDVAFTIPQCLGPLQLRTGHVLVRLVTAGAVRLEDLLTLVVDRLVHLRASTARDQQESKNGSITEPPG